MPSRLTRSLQAIVARAGQREPPDRVSPPAIQAHLPPQPAPETASPKEERRRVLRRKLSARILHQHLQRRRLTLESQPDNLEGLGLEEATLLIRAMAAAGHADGALDPRERRRLLRALATTRLDPDQRRALAAELEEPPCLESLARQVKTPEMAALFYAVSVVAAQRGKVTNASYLNYLATRLRLPADVVVRLNRRYDVPA